MYNKLLRPTDAKILLASNSPRRKELLKMIVDDFGVAEMHEIDEVYPDTLKAEDVPAYLSQLKANAYRDQLTYNEIIITADTVVINDGKILGKPADADEAFRMLCSLKNKEHIVVSGVTLTSINHSVTFSETTKVRFADVTDDEIRLYISNFQPFDKAGAYGIQEWIGCIGIDRIEGCFYNVMGLPLYALYQNLKKFKA